MNLVYSINGCADDSRIYNKKGLLIKPVQICNRQLVSACFLYGVVIWLLVFRPNSLMVSGF